MENRFTIRGEYIELIKLLKAAGLAENGAHAQAMVEQNEVKVNSVTETRKRAKIRPGDKVEAAGNIIYVE
jgi:ribosome-associated protein